MSLQFVQIFVIRQVSLEVLRLAESIQVSEYRVALQMSGIADQQMLGIGVHAHDLGAYIVCTV